MLDIHSETHDAVPLDGPGDLESARREIVRLRRLLDRREYDVSMLASLYAHSRRLGQSFEKERDLRRLYDQVLLRNIPNFIYVLDNALRFVMGSQAGGRLTRGRPESLLNKPLTHIFSQSVAPDWISRLQSQCLEALSGAASRRDEDVIVLGREDGREPETIYAQTNVLPIVDDDGEGRGVLIVILDVTALLEAKHKAEGGDKAKSAFLANMSHEIRTPLHSIKGFGEILAGTQLDDRQHAYLGHALEAAEALLGLIDDMLDFSKIDAGKMELFPAPYSPLQLVSEVANLVALRAEQKGLDFLISVSPDLPSRLVGDAPRLRQILVNLLSNAIKYTSAGWIKLTLRSETRSGGLFLVAAVEDTGQGIKPEHLPGLFSAFARLDPQTNRHIAGVGLGLAISSRLALAMDGGISVNSHYGRGSVFTLEAPQAVDDSRPVCRLSHPGDCRVLLLGRNPCLDNVAGLCEALGVAYRQWAPPPPAAADPAQEWALPEAWADEGFTHCLHTGGHSAETLARLRRTLPPGPRLGELRGLREPPAYAGRPEEDAVIFNPCQLADLAEFLEPGSFAACGESAAGVSAGGAFDTRGVKALVVDDHELNLLVCEEFLREYGVEVSRAASGLEALDLCRERTFDLIFLDHMMPHMDGVELARRLRRGDSPNRRAPLVALTANVVNNTRDYYLQNGLDDMLSKPIDRAELARVLLKFLPPEKIFPRTASTPGK